MSRLSPWSNGPSGGSVTAAAVATALGGENAVTAFATGGQTNATALSSSVTNHRISVCATAADSVKLPAATVGQVHYVRNDGAAAAQVFGQATETINGVASATGVVLGVGAGVWYVCTVAGAWTTTFNPNSPTFTGVAKGADGLVGAPSWSFTNYADKGMYSGAAGTLDFAVAGVNRLSVRSDGIGSLLTTPSGNWSLLAPSGGGLYLGAAGDAKWTINTSGNLVTVVATNTIDIGAAGATSPRTVYSDTSFVNQGANGQNIGLKKLTELTTIAAAATTDTTIQMPAGAVVLAVSVRVTTVIPTAANFTVGDSGSAARFSTAAVSTAATSTDKGTKAGAYYNASALSVRITPDLTPADDTGRVRVTIHYLEVTPPTS